MIITDIGSLAHALRRAGELVNAIGAPYGTRDVNRLLRRLYTWPLGSLPASVTALADTDPGALNQALNRRRVAGQPFAQSGYRFAQLHRQIGVVTSLYWWLVLDVPGMCVVPGLPQVVVPTERLSFYQVEGRQYPLVRFPTKHHGDLWLTHTSRLLNDIQVVTEVLDVMQAPRSQWSTTFSHVVVPVFFGYRDSRLKWLDDTKLRVSSHGHYGLGPFIQQVRAGLNLNGVPRQSRLVTGRVLELDYDLLAFVTPPTDFGTPYAVMGIERNIDWLPML